MVFVFGKNIEHHKLNISMLKEMTLTQGQGQGGKNVLLAKTLGEPKAHCDVCLFVV